MIGVAIQFTNDGRAHAVNIEVLEADKQKQKKQSADGTRRPYLNPQVTFLLTNADRKSIIAQQQQNSQVKSSLRDQSAVSDRELLSGALMEAAQTEDERAKEKALRNIKKQKNRVLCRGA